MNEKELLELIGGQAVSIYRLSKENETLRRAAQEAQNQAARLQGELDEAKEKMTVRFDAATLQEVADGQ